MSSRLCFLASAAAFAILDRRRSRGVALGYAGHLLCDLWAGAEVPWLAPFQPMPRRRRKSHLHHAIFLLPELGKTMAELSMDEKNRLSHRARAVMRAKEILTQVLR